MHLWSQHLHHIAHTCTCTCTCVHMLCCSIVKPLYSGHSVKQPPHYYSHLLDNGLYMLRIGWLLSSRPKGRSWPRELWFSIYSVFALKFIKQPPLYFSCKFMAQGDHYRESPLYCLASREYATYMYISVQHHLYTCRYRGGLAEPIPHGPRDSVVMCRTHNCVLWPSSWWCFIVTSVHTRLWNVEWFCWQNTPAFRSDIIPVIYVHVGYESLGKYCTLYAMFPFKHQYMYIANT